MERWSMSYGEVPERERFLAHVAARLDEDGALDPLTTYPMEIVSLSEWEAIKAAVNQGIDAHLEAVQFSECGPADRKYVNAMRIVIDDPGSLHTLIRRLCEIGNDPALELVSCVLGTLDIEWI